MFNAGGYNDGANQFAGGGFMPSQAPDSGMKEGKKGNSQGNQTLRAVTIRQLIRDVAATDDDSYMVDGVELQNVTVLGKVMSVQDSNTSRLVLTINDGTGELTVTSWSPDDTDQQFGNRRNEHSVGSYVRVFGHVRVFDKQKSLQAFKIAKVHDSNEITYHNMQCVFQHVHLTRGGAGRPAAEGGAAYGAMPAYGGGNQAGGWNNQQQPMQQNFGNNGAGNGMSPVQNAVFQMLSNTDEAGVSVDQIVGQLAPQGFNRGHILQALDFLQNEGHAFTTIDENHWKASG